jgi:hypothetical protein
MSRRLRSGMGYDAPNKQNGTRLDVTDQKDEGAINGDLNGWWRSCPRAHHCGGGCGFCARFIHGYERLVYGLSNEKLAGTVHP